LGGQGALGESSGAETEGWKAGVVMDNGGNAAVNNVALSGGAWLKAETRR